MRIFFHQGHLYFLPSIVGVHTQPLCWHSSSQSPSPSGFGYWQAPGIAIASTHRPHHKNHDWWAKGQSEAGRRDLPAYHSRAAECPVRHMHNKLDCTLYQFPCNYYNYIPKKLQQQPPL